MDLDVIQTVLDAVQGLDSTTVITAFCHLTHRNIGEMVKELGSSRK